MVNLLIMKIQFKIHIFFYITSLILLFCGYFKEYISVMLLIFIHECGHILMGKIYKWKILKIFIYPFGAMTRFDIDLNTNVFEEFMVTIMGPIFQIIGCIIIYFFTKDNIIIEYNNLILFLNLLPIVPLDGSKLVESLLFKIFPYKKSLLVNLTLSIITLIFCLTYVIINFNFLLLIWLILLVIENIKEYNQISLKFYLFIKERLENHYKFKYRYISGKSINNIKKDYLTIFKNNDKFYTEREIIKTYLYKYKKYIRPFDNA